MLLTEIAQRSRVFERPVVGRKAATLEVATGLIGQPPRNAMQSVEAHLFKQAPGTKASFTRIDNGVVMTVSAASAEYVPVVQKAVMTEIEGMTAMAGACAVSAAKAGESCSFTKNASVQTASTEKAGASCSTAKTEQASVEKVSTQKAGSSCCASKGAAAKASVEQASMSASNCPDWMKVLCGSNCTIENTSTGIKITWTTEKAKLAPLQAAGEQLEAEISRL